MKKILSVLIFTIIAYATYGQQMVIKKTDGSNSKIDLTSIEGINFIIPCPGTPTVDYGGKTYNTVLIGTQCWIKENMDVGTMLNNTWPGNNGTIEKYCYNNLPANCETYGGLYTWEEAMQWSNTEGAQGICPSGWHLPTLADVQTLINYVDNDGNALKNENQGSGSGQGTNSTGFSALLGGGKQYSTVNIFQSQGVWGEFYTSKYGTCGYGCVYTFQVKAVDDVITFQQGTMPSWGMSVRCIKDN